MSRRQSLDRPGILSPPGPFLTPSPSPSISASPRLLSSPSLSPFPQDVLLVASHSLTNATTHEQERKTLTPGRRQSIHQFTSSSPNAGTVVFQPSPSQSPAAATSVVGVTAGGINVVAASIANIGSTLTSPATGHDLNTTLVGSNNIQLNKKGAKRQQPQPQQHHQQQQQQHQHIQIFNNLGQQYSINSSNSSGSLATTTALVGGYGQSHIPATNTSPNTFAAANVACSPKGQTKKNFTTNNVAATNTVLSSTNQPMQQQQQQQQSSHQSSQHPQHIQQYNTNSPLLADSPSPTPNSAITAATIKPTTPQPTTMQAMLQTTFTNNGGVGGGAHQTFQLIQGPQGQIIAATAAPHHQQQQQQQPQRFVNGNVSTMINTNSKSSKAPQQILPKPHQQQQQHSQQSFFETNPQAQQQQQQQHQTITIAHHPAHNTIQAQQQKTKNSTSNNSMNTPVNDSAMSQTMTHITQSSQQGAQQQILIPSGSTTNLATTQQPLLLNQVPVLVQQNTPQGVQLILRPPTPQLTATPSLVIQNARPQAQLQAQQQPQLQQQLLRILGTNGATMQLAAAAPTFIVSSQANLIQQGTNLQTIKTNPQAPAITQISGLHAALSAAAAANSQPRSQQFTTTAATINGHILGPSMAAQLQNLQLAAAAAAHGNGITAQIQMPNGLTSTTAPTLLSQLPTAQFSQGTAQGLINFSQLSGANLQQLAAAAASGAATFQTPAAPVRTSATAAGSNNVATSSSNVMSDIFNGQASAALANMTHNSPNHRPVALTPEPLRQSTPISQNIPAGSQQQVGIQLNINAAATIQMQQHQQQQQQAQIQQLQQQIQQTQSQVQQAQKQAQLQQQQQQQQTPPETIKKKPRPRKKKQPLNATTTLMTNSNSNTNTLQANNNNNSSNEAALSAPGKSTNTVVATKTFGTASSTTTTLTVPATLSTTNSNVMVPFSLTTTPTTPTISNMAINQIKTHGNATTAPQTSQLSANVSSTYKPASPPPQITRASNGKLDLGNVMKLCGIMEDDDDCEDYAMDTGIMPVAHDDVGSNNTEMSMAMSQSNQEQQKSEVQPFTLTIPGCSTSNSGNTSTDSTATNIVIKIDAGDTGLGTALSGSTPYSITIPSLPTAEEINAQAQKNTQINQQPKASLPQVPTNINFSLAAVNQVTPTGTNVNGLTPVTISSHVTNTTTNVTSNSKTNTLVPSTSSLSSANSSTATVKPRRKPATKRNAKKQDVSNATMSATTTSVTTTITNTNINQMAPAINVINNINNINNNNNNSFSSSLPTPPSLVPSHIGNIQISQIDASRLTQNTNNVLSASLGGIVDNKIQIMPIVNKIAANGATPLNVQATQFAAQPQSQIVFQATGNLGIQVAGNGNNTTSPNNNLMENQTRQMHLVAIPNHSTSSTMHSLTPAGSLTISQAMPTMPNNVSTNSASSGNVSVSVSPQASISSLIPHLTGSLTLAVSEQCERLILRHDPNLAQDQQSQLILQALLKGALPNVTIINEPLRAENANKISVQTSQMPTQQLPASSGAISKNNKKTTNTNVGKQNNVLNTTTVASTNDSSSRQTGNKASSEATVPVTAGQGTTTFMSLQQQQRYVALPRIDPSTQQLFCLNTLNNQITPMGPNQTTASIAPTERLLIAPAGINAQQLAQCLQQGQIHFNDVNPQLEQHFTHTLAPSSLSTQQQPKQQIVHPLTSNVTNLVTTTVTTVTTIGGNNGSGNQSNLITTTTTTTKQVANVAPIIDQSKTGNKQNVTLGSNGGGGTTSTTTVPKKKPVRRPKAATTTAADVALMKNATLVKPLPKLDPLSQKPNNNPVQIVQPNTASGKPVTATNTNGPLTATTPSLTTINTNVASVQPFQTQVNGGTKLIGVTAPMQQQPQSTNNVQQQQQPPQQNNLNILRPQLINPTHNFSLSSLTNSSSSICANTATSVGTLSGGGSTQNSSSTLTSNTTNSPPSLTSIQQQQQQQQQQQSTNINTYPATELTTPSSSSSTTSPNIPQQQPQHTVSRVQTIQLTPQQQQMFRHVQMQIQYLTYKMQHKSIITSLPLPPEFDPNIVAPFNKTMTDFDINTALQRLFIEQQSILASGKEIPTPEGFITNPPPCSTNINFTTQMPPATNENNKNSMSSTNSNNNNTTNATANNNNHSQSSGNIIPVLSVASSNSTNSAANGNLQQLTQRIHIYPIQHHQQPNKVNTKKIMQQQLHQVTPGINSMSTNITSPTTMTNASDSISTVLMANSVTSTNTNLPQMKIGGKTTKVSVQHTTPTSLPMTHNTIQFSQPPPLTAQSLQLSLSPLLQSAQHPQMINISNMPAILQQKHFTQHLQQQILQQQQKLQNAKATAAPPSLTSLSQSNFVSVGVGVAGGGPPPLVFPNSSVILTQQSQLAHPLQQPPPQQQQQQQQLPLHIQSPQQPTLPSLSTSFVASLTTQKCLISTPTNTVATPTTTTSVTCSSNGNSSGIPNNNNLTTSSTTNTLPISLINTITSANRNTEAATQNALSGRPPTTNILTGSTTAISTITTVSLTPTTTKTITNMNAINNNYNQSNVIPNTNASGSNISSESTTHTPAVGGAALLSQSTPSLPIIGLKLENHNLMSPKQKLARLSLFLRQLEVDQKSCLNADYTTPFQSKEDTVKRLIRYHCMYQNDEDIPSEEEDQFERAALKYQDKFRLLSGKFQQILLQESTLPHSTSESCQLEQLLVEDLKQEIEESRRLEKMINDYETSEAEYIKEFNNQNQNEILSMGFDDNKSRIAAPEMENKSVTDAVTNTVGSTGNYTISNNKQFTTKNEVKTDALDGNNLPNPQGIKYPTKSLTLGDMQNSQTSISNSINKPEQLQQSQNFLQRSLPNHMPITKAAKKEDIFNSWSTGDAKPNTSYYGHLANSSTAAVVTKALTPLPNGITKKSLINETQSNKGDFENFDIESEITPSFIMKKVEPRLNQTKVTTTPQTSCQSITRIDQHISQIQLTNDKIKNGSKTTSPRSNALSNEEVSKQNCQKLSSPVIRTNHFDFCGNSNLLNNSSGQNFYKQQQQQQQHEDEDWLCIQKEFSLINNEIGNPHKKSDYPQTDINQTQQQQQQQQQNRNHRQVMPKTLDFLTESNAEDQFENGCIEKTSNGPPPSGCSQQTHRLMSHELSHEENHQHDLNEFFSGSEDSDIQKSVESRLEAMFSGSPVHISGSKSSSLDNSNDIESGLESIFGESVKSPTQIDQNKNKSTSWDRELVDNSYITVSQQATLHDQTNTTTTAFMNDTAVHSVQQMQQLNNGNTVRWIQNMEAHFSDFISNNHPETINNTNEATTSNSLSDCLVVNRKRHWNGHVIGTATNNVANLHEEDEVPHRKLCTNMNRLTSTSTSMSSSLSSSTSSPLSQPASSAQCTGISLPSDTSHAQDLMEAALLSLHDGLGVDPNAEQLNNADPSNFQNLLIQQNHFGSFNNSAGTHHHIDTANRSTSNFVNSDSAGHLNMTHNVINLNNTLLQQMQHHTQPNSASHHNHNNASGGHEFDDDITRHVQNAIDSILNLQSNESDSLPFSLDHSMGSFLSDSILDDRQSTATVGATILPETTRRRHLVDELGDCLMGNANAAQASSASIMENGMLMNIATNHAQLINHANSMQQQVSDASNNDDNDVTINNNSTNSNNAATAAPIAAQHQSLNDFNCVVTTMDEAVKSIMTS